MLKNLNINETNNKGTLIAMENSPSSGQTKTNYNNNTSLNGTPAPKCPLPILPQSSTIIPNQSASTIPLSESNVSTIPFPVMPSTISSDGLQSLGMFHACAAGSQYWQLRLISLMAEQQMNVMNCLNEEYRGLPDSRVSSLHMTKQSCARHHRHCRRSARTLHQYRDGACRFCGQDGLKRSRRRKTSKEQEEKGGLWFNDGSRSDSDSDEMTSDSEIDDGWDRRLSSVGVRRRHERYDEKSTENRDSKSHELRYWDEVVVSCELNHQYEIQLVDYLKHLSTEGLPPTLPESQSDEPSPSLSTAEMPRQDPSTEQSSSSIATSPPQSLPLLSSNEMKRSTSPTTDTSQQDQQSPSQQQRQSYFTELELSYTPLPDWSHQQSKSTLFSSQQPLLSQLDQELQTDIFHYKPPHYEHISASTPATTESPSSASQPIPQPQQRRRLPYNPPPDEDESQVPPHPLERFPFGIYVRVGVIMVVLGLPTECLMLIGLIAGVHLSGGLDPFLNWLSSLEARWRNGPWFITNRRPLNQVLAELQQRRQLRRETASLVEQAQRILGQLHEAAAQTRPTPTTAGQADESLTSINAQTSNRTETENVPTSTVVLPPKPSELVETDSTTGQLNKDLDNNASPTQSSLAQSSSTSITSSSSSQTGTIHSSSVQLLNESLPNLQIPRTSETNRIVVGPIGGRQHNLVILDAVPVPPSSRIESWLMSRPVLRSLVVRLDWWARWFYQLILALIFSLNPSWQPLTAFVSELPLLPALASAQAVSLVSVSASVHHGSSNSNDRSYGIIGSHVVVDSSKQVNVTSLTSDDQSSSSSSSSSDADTGASQIAATFRSIDDIKEKQNDGHAKDVTEVVPEPSSLSKPINEAEEAEDDGRDSDKQQNEILRKSSNASSSAQSVFSEWSESSLVETFGSQPNESK